MSRNKAMTSSSKDVTPLLIAWNQGDESARDKLMPIVYNDLRRLAQRYLRRERSNHTLQPTALVHETYLRLIDQSQVNWQSRTHFLGIVARMMRQILVNHAEARHAAKRGGSAERISLSGIDFLAQKKSS